MSIKELALENFSFKFKEEVYQDIVIALKVFNEFIEEKREIFILDKRETLFGYLRTYIIEKQLFFTFGSSYNARLKEVNKYKYRSLIMETNNFILTIGKTESPNELLPASKYRKEFAKQNGNLDRQLCLPIPELEKNSTVDKYYAQITYGYKNNTLSHLNIIIPSSNYKSISYSINIMYNIQMYNIDKPKEVIEEQIVRLKKSITEEASKIV